MFKFKIETNIYFLNHLYMSWLVVGNARGHKRNPNGILGLLCWEHFPELVEYAEVMGPIYSFDHYNVTTDVVQ
jgi:hypothetical protein